MEASANLAFNCGYHHLQCIHILILKMSCVSAEVERKWGVIAASCGRKVAGDIGVGVGQAENSLTRSKVLMHYAPADCNSRQIALGDHVTERTDALVWGLELPAYPEGVRIHFQCARRRSVVIHTTRASCGVVMRPMRGRCGVEICPMLVAHGVQIRSMHAGAVSS